LLAGGVASVLASVLIGLPALRLKGLYFAIATLAAQFILDYLFKFAEPITHWRLGPADQADDLVGSSMQSDTDYAVLAITIVLDDLARSVLVRRTDLGEPSWSCERMRSWRRAWESTLPGRRCSRS